MSYIAKNKVESFTDLKTWQEAHKLDQMQRCAISITSNTAEGFSRQSRKEKLQFYYIAKGSLTELQNQLLVARDVGFLPREKFNELAQLTVTVGKLLTGLTKSAARHINYEKV